MSLKWTPPSFLLVLLMISGVVVAQHDGSVYYTQKYICAGRGSTVTMSCNLHSKVVKAFWSKDFLDLSSDSKYKDRVQHINTQHDCSLRLRDVTKDDHGIYYCMFVTSAGERFQGAEVSLSVTELEVEILNRVIEGDAVTVSCKTRCRLTTTPIFSWYKNGHRLLTYNKLLRLQSVRHEDAGNYSCAILGHNYQSPAVALEVQYLSSGQVKIFGVAVGVVLCVVAAFLAGVFCMRRKRQNTSNHENVHSSPPEDPYMALDPRFISSDYANLTTAGNQQ
ncbi:hypothetical protein KOW79_020962 [Hemibagrus wyckioides]|uniref:Ig-like domain-containing protein n=2 Tax=Hemibagrus wyckioides TaxID=337641 RepID=A0A9D3N4V1_9TELE|nr:hypothetical protein KOW79_020962 [Hemibagrus wyckioides]